MQDCGSLGTQRTGLVLLPTLSTLTRYKREGAGDQTEGDQPLTNGGTSGGTSSGGISETRMNTGDSQVFRRTLSPPETDKDR